MSRSETLRELSAIVRRDPWSALWAVGFLTMDADEETLQNLLQGLREVGEALRPPDHYEAYRERWGHVPTR